ncbi:MAG: phage baseplate assembly protein V, partial [Bacteroidales bacterium]|nr:phage baseplate assembly protein V [Bacteroidales bacterium]
MQPKTSISIDGEFISTFERISLNQVINDHHKFDVFIDYDSIEAQGGHTIDKSKKWLGKSIVINFDSAEFVGLITNIQLTHDNGFNGKLKISGYSPTILLDDGAHLHSWLEKDLASIVSDTIDAAGLDSSVAPAFKSPIEYMVQYRENHFQFLKRLANQYNEWFMYDGVKLVFGKPSSAGSAIPIEYGKDMEQVNVSLKTAPSAASVFSYNSSDDKHNTSQTKDNVSGLNELGTFAFNTSKDIHKIKPVNYSGVRVKDKSEIDNTLKNKQASAVADVHTLSGTSTKQGLTVGSVIKVSSARYENGSFDEKNYGEYLIIKISHEAAGTDEYKNHFEAIPSGIEVLPPPVANEPIAEAQMATVLSNEDPKKKGRVQVQFNWQSGDMKSSWIRVLTPDAGKSDNVGSNRGFVFIPEKDDQVMVGFRYNDPNRPFVMGGLFNGTTGAGGSDGNKTKSIITASGSTIKFEDGEGDGKITVSDPSGSTITLNGDETVTISAPKSITMNSKKIELKAEEEISIAGDSKVEISSKEIKGGASTMLELNSDANMKVSSITKEEKHTKFNLEAQATVDINGTAMTNVKGGVL